MSINHTNRWINIEDKIVILIEWYFKAINDRYQPIKKAGIAEGRLPWIRANKNAEANTPKYLPKCPSCLWTIALNIISSVIGFKITKKKK